MLRPILRPTVRELLTSPFGAAPYTVAYSAPQVIGVVSSADPDVLLGAPITGSDLWLYFVDFDGTGGRGRIKRAVSSDGGATWGAPTVALDQSGAATPYNLETPSVFYRSDGSSWIYGLAYQVSPANPANGVYVGLGDPTAFAWAAPAVIAPGQEGTYDALYIMEPDAIEVAGVTHVIYHGAASGIGGSLLHCDDSVAKDGYSFINHAAIFRAGLDAPAGAFYHGAASPSIIKVGSDWIMAFTGLNADVSNAGGIGLAKSSAATPASGWTFGPNVVWEPYVAGGDTVSPLTGAALNYDAATGMLGCWHSAVVDPAIDLGYGEISLSDALAKAGL